MSDEGLHPESPRDDGETGQDQGDAPVSPGSENNDIYGDDAEDYRPPSNEEGFQELPRADSEENSPDPNQPESPQEEEEEARGEEEEEEAREPTETADREQNSPAEEPEQEPEDIKFSIKTEISSQPIREEVEEAEEERIEGGGEGEEGREGGEENGEERVGGDEGDEDGHRANAEDAAEEGERRPRTPNEEEDDEFNEKEGEEESPSKKRRVVLDSDDEDDERDKERTEGGEEGGEKSPTKSKRILDSDDEDKDSDDEERRTRKQEGEEEEEEGEEGEKDVGDLMAHIFGDESDEEKEGGEGRGEEEGGEDDGVRRRDDRDDEDNFEWDFDVMLAQKKAQKKRRKKRRDGGIDIINDDDGTIEMIVTAMKEAAKEDRHSNMEQRPALKKRKMLPQVKTFLLRADMMEAMIDGGMMSAVSEWLAPLPDKSLPALEIRTEILKILQSYTRLEQSILKQSGLGKAIMLLFKHPRETKENKKLAHKLISDWARPIFQLDTDYRSMTKDERIQRDLDHMPAAKKRRLSSDDGPASSGSALADEPLGPGQKGFVGRARVPKISTKDYVVRPRSTVEGTFKGEKKSRGFARLDKAQRDFKERTKAFKAQRAVGVSIEGRKMEI